MPGTPWPIVTLLPLRGNSPSTSLFAFSRPQRLLCPGDRPGEKGQGQEWGCCGQAHSWGCCRPSSAVWTPLIALWARRAQILRLFPKLEPSAEHQELAQGNAGNPSLPLQLRPQASAAFPTPPNLPVPAHVPPAPPCSSPPPSSTPEAWSQPRKDGRLTHHNPGWTGTTKLLHTPRLTTHPLSASPKRDPLSLPAPGKMYHYLHPRHFPDQSTS